MRGSGPASALRRSVRRSRRQMALLGIAPGRPKPVRLQLPARAQTSGSPPARAPRRDSSSSRRAAGTRRRYGPTRGYRRHMAGNEQMTTGNAPQLSGLFGVYLQVGDLDRSLSFYRDVLALKVAWNDGALAVLHSHRGPCRLAGDPGGRQGRPAQNGRSRGNARPLACRGSRRTGQRRGTPDPAAGALPPASRGGSRRHNSARSRRARDRAPVDRRETPRHRATSMALLVLLNGRSPSRRFSWW